MQNQFMAFGSWIIPIVTCYLFIYFTIRENESENKKEPERKNEDMGTPGPDTVNQL